MNVMAADLPIGLTRARGGAPLKPMDEARFEAFYRKNAPGVWAYLRRLTGNPAAADDLLQKTFVRLIRANPTFASEDHMRRYAYRAATSVAMDHFRETTRRAEVAEVDPGAARGDGA